MTNFEKIKQMSVEELAKFIEETSSGGSCDFCVYSDNCPNVDCKIGIKWWLKSEAEE